MQGRSFYTTSHVKFKSFSPSIAALQKYSLKDYISEISPFKTILAGLHKRGLFTHISAIDYTMNDFLKSYFEVQDLNERSFFLSTPVDLIAQPLPLPQEEGQDTVYTKELSSLFELINCYLAMLLDVLNNQLAQKPYEKISDKEDVTEQEHALQAGKMALLLGMSLSDVLALLFHDIARPSVDDPLHGHSNHCQEGSTILSPLGLSVDYSGYHALAKYLLSEFCPNYEFLISDVSKYTLRIQKGGLNKEAQGLNQLDAESLASYLFQIMFMRLIDDMSKVPELVLKEKAQYFNNETILLMLKEQMITHLKEEMKNSKDTSETIAGCKAKLEAAISLMSRAKSQTNDPDLYEGYKDILEQRIEQRLRQF